MRFRDKLWKNNHIIIFFQFSLWDSCWDRTQKSYFFIRTFNSLYEIRLLGEYCPWGWGWSFQFSLWDSEKVTFRQPKLLHVSFNSLYEIQSEIRLLNVLRIHILSILFMRFPWDKWNRCQRRRPFNSLYEIHNISHNH